MLIFIITIINFNNILASTTSIGAVIAIIAWTDLISSKIIANGTAFDTLLECPLRSYVCGECRNRLSTFIYCIFCWCLGNVFHCSMSMIFISKQRIKNNRTPHHS